MKKIFLMVTLLVFFAQAQELKMMHNYEKAIQLATKEKKKILMFVYQDFCPWCQKMEDVTLSDNKAIEFINKRYIFVVQNKDSGNYPKKLFYPRFIPTTYLIDPKDDEEIFALYGYKPSEKLINELTEFQ